MLKEELLMCAIEKVKKSGCKDYDYIKNVVEVNIQHNFFVYEHEEGSQYSMDLSALLFDREHKFAKGFFGMGHQVCSICNGLDLFIDDKKKIYCNTCGVLIGPVSVKVINGWRENIRNLAAADDYIKYLERFL